MAIPNVYPGIKDFVTFFSGQRRRIKNMEKRISALINHVALMNSEREKIDGFLKNSVSKVESPAYKVTKAEIGVINENCIKLIDEYKKATNNQLISSSTTELNASTMIVQLNDHKTDVVTLKFFEYAKLSGEFAKLSVRASEAVRKLKPELMTQDRLKPIQDKFDDVVPVSKNAYVDEVLEYLFGDEVDRIGIFGCQGAGKTTVLRKLHDLLLEQESRFHYVIWLEYPQETEKQIVETLQNEIMQQLPIHDEAATSTVKNANTISTFLRHRKYVLLMDNVSTSIDLDKLGLREGHEHKKFVICSREKYVLDRMMTERNVKIQGLDVGEAVKLIESICGELNQPWKKAIAERISECCQGIPWIVTGIANYLKDKNDEETWNGVKDILQSDTKSLGLLELSGFDKVYEMKYQALETHVKKCLLYSALFPRQLKIYKDYLVECWIAEGFIVSRAEPKIRASRDRGKIILNKLTNDDLLQWHSGEKCIMMAPNFRRVAVGLNYLDEENGAIWELSKDGKPNDTTWTTVTRMSLIGCEMELPQSPQCCNIYTLLLQSSKQESGRLPDSFFTRMGSLQVLDLNQTEITALPESINKLVNLKSLYLNGCLGLGALPPEAASLKELEFLDICGTSISTLPQEIRFMVNMRCLRASLSTRGGDPNSKGKQVEGFEVIIPPDIISNLKNLEELSIVTDFEFQSKNGIDVVEKLANELASLELLNTLCFNFPNVSSLDKFVTQSKALKNKSTFRSFKIFIGCHQTRRACEPDLTLAERWLRYSTNEEFSEACQELLNEATAFEIIGHDHLKSFTCSQFDLHSVKVCVVEGCKNLENIVDGFLTTEDPRIVEENLHKNMEKLYLYNLKSLKCIRDGPVPHESLTKLTAITIEGCPNLTRILDPAFAHSLQSLEYLKVENCDKISKIIDGCGETRDIVEVPDDESSKSELLKKLRKIELLNLPELESICESTSISWNSLKSIVVMRCSKLINLSLTNARKLALIECEESWWNTLTSDELKQRLLPRCCFKEESIGGGAQSRDEASTSGRSEFLTEHSTALSSTNVDDEEDTILCDNLQALQIDSSSLEDDAIKQNGNHQPFDHEALTLTGQLAPAV